MNKSHIIYIAIIVGIFLAYLANENIKDFKYAESPAPTRRPIQKQDLENYHDEIRRVRNEKDKLIDKTPYGNLIYNDPGSVPLYGTTNIELIISPSMALEELQPIMKAPGEIIYGRIKVGKRMKAILKGDTKVSIIELTDPEQLIGENHPTAWMWQIEGLKHGTSTLTLIVSVLETIDETKEPIWNERYINTFEVTVYWYSRIVMLIKENFTLLFGGGGLGLLGLIVLIWNIFVKKWWNNRKSTKPPGTNISPPAPGAAKQ